MKLIISNGKHLVDDLQNFPMADEFTPSHTLVVGRSNSHMYAACGLRSVFNVLTLYVDGKCRGRGLGSLVLRKTISVAKKQNLSFLTLIVLPSNLVALHLYYKFGFREITRLENYVLMMLPLTSGGELAYRISHATCSLLPTGLLNKIGRLVYKRGLSELSSSEK